MPDSLAVLETQRAAIQRRISQLGDMRPGSITTTAGAGTHTAIATRRTTLVTGRSPARPVSEVNGKTVTETFPTLAALRKAQNEIAEFHRFRELSQDLVAVNEKICQTRPVEDRLSPQKKRRTRSKPRSRAK